MSRTNLKPRQQLAPDVERVTGAVDLHNLGQVRR